MRRLIISNQDVISFVGIFPEGSITPRPLKSLIDVLQIWHGSGSSMVVTQLLSIAYCPEQKQHEDNIYPVTGRRFFCDIPFSCIIALEENDNRSCIVDSDGLEVIFRKGSLVIFRGDYRHSGASYTMVNSRLHIAVCNHEKLAYLDHVYNVTK